MDKIMGIGVGVIIKNKEGKILLLLRNNNQKIADSDMHYEGQYTLPAGKVKFGEKIEDCAIRKVKEETDLDVKDVKVICFVNDKNEFAHYATLGVLAKDYRGKISLGNSKEQVDYFWSDINNLPINTCESSRKIIDRYLSNLFYKENE